MKPRHQPRAGTAERTVLRDESGTADAAVVGEQVIRELANVELHRGPTRQFLKFKTRDGRTFHWNLDCQEEYGFEAREVMQQWAAEQ